MSIRLIVHGGAWNVPTEQQAAHVAGIRAAVAHVVPLLEAGGTALDAVEAAVNILEADTTFDAGHGAFLNSQGEIELDALIMDGATLDFGAVAAVQNLLHPVSVARRLMETAEFRMLVGAGAQAFARAQNFPILDPQALLTERELSFFGQIKEEEDFRSHHPFGELPGDTVGAVALDSYGNLAAATSTGGTPRKWPGRVGDSPLPGAGAYADNASGGASTTGWGESIMKILLAKTVTDQLELGKSAPAAARYGIRRLADKVQGLGGVITISNQGEYGWYHNTPKMAFAFWEPKSKKIKTVIQQEDL